MSAVVKPVRITSDALRRLGRGPMVGAFDGIARRLETYLDETEREAGMLRVTIMYRNTYDGGDGWTYHPLAVTIADRCPECGGPRGAPRPHTFCEDGEWFTVDRWDNPCGHVDTYRACYHEARLEAAMREETT